MGTAYCKHIWINHNDSLRECSKCGQINTRSWKYVKSHAVQCKVCNKLFPSQQILESHLDKEHRL